jgi:hypothetical protein
VRIIISTIFQLIFPLFESCVEFATVLTSQHVFIDIPSFTHFSAYQSVCPRKTNMPFLRNLSRYCQGIQTKISTQCLYYQSHGRVDLERHQSVLCICRGETKGIYICVYKYVNMNMCIYFNFIYIYIYIHVERFIYTCIQIHIYINVLISLSTRTGALLKHLVLKIRRQSEYHLLQLREQGGTPCQENHRTRLFLLLYPCQNETAG